MRVLAGFLLLFLLKISSVFPICRPLDDAAFYGIFGKIYLREHSCKDVDAQELRSYIANRVSDDGLYYVEDSSIGSIKTELVANNRANQVIAFSCINCQIKNIEKEGIKKWLKLYNLTLVGNDFDSFDGTYIKNDNLRFQYLNLTNNNIKKVENLCLGVPTTKVIVLRDNPIQTIDENIFKGCPNLLHLDLSNTSVTLSKVMFQNLSKLDELHLANLKLKSLDKVYLNIPNLTYLDIAQNGLNIMDTALFDHFPSLRILNLNGNNISRINYHVDKVKTFPLRQLFLQNNGLENISMIDLEYFKEIQTLDLSFNKIKEIPVHFFEHSIDLRHLMLSHNQVKKLSVGTFSPVGNLVHLDISYNNFSALDEHMFHSLPLEELHISGNNLTSMDDTLFSMYNMLNSMGSTLKRLDISDLKWKCKTLRNIVRLCKSYNINCLPKEGPNFKTTNVEGITCIDNKTTISSYFYNPGLNDEFNLNLTRDKIIEQNKLYLVHLNKIGGIYVVLTLFLVFFMIFVIFNVVVPIVVGYYEKYKNNQNLLSSAHLNVSQMELVHNNVHGQV